MRIGFIGTKDGLTSAQKETLRYLLASWNEQIAEFHHDDNHGASMDADRIVRELKLSYTTIFLHPSHADVLRAHTDKIGFSNGSPRLKIVIKPERPIPLRNCDIAEQTDIMIVAPHKRYYQVQHEEWFTACYASSLKKRVLILFPDGRHQEFYNEYTIKNTVWEKRRVGEYSGEDDPRRQIQAPNPATLGSG